MEKRAFERIKVDLEITFNCCNKTHAGTIADISENGIFICTDEICFPFDSRLEVFIPSEKDNLSVPVYLNRLIMSPDSHDGIGVVLSDPPETYLSFVNNLRSIS